MDKAIVAAIESIVPIEGADRIALGKVCGFNIIVNKTQKVGDKGVFFNAGLQLSPEYAQYNNLHRDADLNRDKSQTGMFDANRRVKALKLRGVVSEGYFAPLDSLDYTCSRRELFFGDQFDKLNGYEVCKKYVSPATLKRMHQNKKTGKKRLAPDFKEHADTDQIRFWWDKITTGSLLSFHSKKHGTSFRCGHILVGQELPVWKEAVNSLTTKLFKVAPFKEAFEYEVVTGTRRVLLKDHQRDKEGFNGPEAWRFEVTDALKPHLEKGMVVYGEICGYANSKPIMGVHNTKDLKDKAFTKKYGPEMVYKYGAPEGTIVWHVYRITVVNASGEAIDYTQKQLERWCADRAVPATLEIHPSFLYDGDAEALKTLVEELTERPEQLCEDYTDPSHISEGIIVRVDGEHLTPKFLKNKSKPFKILEGIYTESNVDEEDAA